MGSVEKPHPYAGLVLGLVLAAIAVTLLTGAPSALPEVALGSRPLFHIERAGAILAALFLVVVVFIRAWQGQLPTKLSLKEIGYPEQAKEAVADAEQAAESAPDSERDPKRESEEPAASDLLELRLKLEAKMTYIAKWLLRDDDRVPYLTIGSLRYDRLLTDEEARTATRVLTLRDEDLDPLPWAKRNEFLANADKVVTNIRAGVFFGLVRELLKKNAWTVKEIDVKSRARPDLLATKDGESYRIVPRYAMDPESEILMTALDDLKSSTAESANSEATVIVIPDRSSSRTDEHADPAVLKLSKLKEKLALEVDPRSLESSDDQ